MVFARTHEGIRLVIFDWAGTLIDHGSLAPYIAFVDLFAQHDIALTTQQARARTGLSKREHLEALFGLPEVASQWRRRYGRAARSSDVDAMFADFVPAQLLALARHGEMLEETPQAFSQLRARGVRIGTTTGYFRAAARMIWQRARSEGVVSDHDVCVDDVSEGRPAPWMNCLCMQALSVFPPERVLVVGDTRADVQAAKNAGCLSVGVARTGNEIGLPRSALSALPLHEQNTRLTRARATLWEAGADFVVDSVAEVPDLLDRVDRSLTYRERARALRRDVEQAHDTMLHDTSEELRPRVHSA
jgi:phosphonoacetaldehyde hydrolase